MEVVRVVEIVIFLAYFHFTLHQLCFTARVSYRIFSLGGRCCVWVNWMGEYFSQVTPRNGAKSIMVSFC